MVTYIDLSDKSIDYLTAISDIRKSIAFRRGRGWSWEHIVQMLEGLGHLADQNINVLLIDMASKEDSVMVNHPLYDKGEVVARVCTDDRSKAGNCNCEVCEAIKLEDGVIPPGYTRCSDGTLVESPPMLGTEADHPNHKED